jgi:hypothetical protein
MVPEGTLSAASPHRARHLPFAAGTMRMGLSPIPEDEWLEFGADHDEQMAAKRALLATRRDAVLLHLPGSDAASAETLEAIRDVLRKHHPDRDRNAAPETHPLEAASRLVQEDLCVLQPGEGGYRLVAGCVCFPSNWSLAEKLGQPVRAIHGPVPGFDPTLADPVDRFFERLDPGRLVMRFNWLVHDTPELHQVDRVPELTPISAEEAGERLWLRVERQVLRRLPRSGGVLFTIRTHVHPLGEAIATPKDAAALAAALRSMAPALWAYRRMDRIGPPLLAWLDARSSA